MKTVGCFKHCLVGHISKSMEDSIAKSYLNCPGLTQEVSAKDVSMLSRDYPCDILWKEVATFCPFPKSLPEVKFRLILLEEEISKQLSIDCFVVTSVTSNKVI